MKNVIITGANRGIGKAILQKLILDCPEFNTYIITATSKESIIPVAEELSNPNIRLIPASLDLSSEESINQLVQLVQSEIGTFDILINNAGIAIRNITPEQNNAKFDTIEERRAFVLANVDHREESIEKTFSVNLFGTMNFTDRLLPFASPRANIVILSSRLGLLQNCTDPLLRDEILDENITVDKIHELFTRYKEAVRSGNVEGWNPLPYGMSKTLLNVYTRILNKNTPDSIEVNSVCPGWVRTAMGGEGAFKSPEEGADTPVFVARSLNTESGKFWAERQIIDW